MEDRTKIEKSLTWDFTHIYKDDKEWEDALQGAEKRIPEIQALQGTLTNSSESLKNGLDLIYEIGEIVNRVYLYAFLQKSLDNGNADYQTKASKAMNLYVSYGMATSFVDPEILSASEEKTSSFLSDPSLADYKHIYEDIARSKAHTLDAKTENMLAMMGEIVSTPENAFEMLEAVDIQFPNFTVNGKVYPLSHALYRAYLESNDRDIRATAFEKYTEQFKNHINTLAATYTGAVKTNNVYAKIRSYNSACEKSLSGSNVPLSVYDNLVAAVRSEIPTMREYIDVRKKILGVSDVHMYDMYCPMVASADMSLTYEQAKEMVKKACAPLGKEYLELLDRAFAERWVDVYETKGKTTGAFSCGVHGVHPYVLLNFTGTLDSAFTLAHELGHSMHSYFSSRENSYANHGYKLLVAEVASTVNEVLLVKYLLSVETDKARKAALLNHLLESFRTTVFRQTLFAEFERNVHEADANGTPLNATSISAIYRKLNEEYYPNAVIDEIHDYEWSRVPHFYNSFYVYQYATGFCSAVKIATDILETKDPSKYLKFLSMGGSDYPIEELKVAGVDLTDPNMVRQSLKEFGKTLDEFKKLI